MMRYGERAHRGQGGYLYGDLWAFWRASLPADAVVYNASISDLGDDPLRPTIHGEAYDMAVSASARRVRAGTDRARAHQRGTHLTAAYR